MKPNYFYEKLLFNVLDTMFGNPDEDNIGVIYNNWVKLTEGISKLPPKGFEYAVGLMTRRTPYFQYVWCHGTNRGARFSAHLEERVGQQILPMGALIRPGIGLSPQVIEDTNSWLFWSEIPPLPVTYLEPVEVKDVEGLAIQNREQEVALLRLYAQGKL